MPPTFPKSRTGKDFPWWLAVIDVAGVAAYAYILLDPDYARILRTLLQGAWVTIFVTLEAFVLAPLLDAGVNALIVPLGADPVLTRDLSLLWRAIIALVIFPQAFRTILPPLGIDFVSMVKDSSPVSVLGVIDITQLGKVTAASNFTYLETYTRRH